MNSLKAMYGCGLNFFIKLAYNSLFYISLQLISSKWNQKVKSDVFESEEFE